MTTKGEFIIERLKPLYPHGDYGLNLYDEWARFRPHKAGSYKNFRMAIAKLKQDGKIEVYQIVPRIGDRNNVWDAKRYYRVTGKF